MSEKSKNAQTPDAAADAAAVGQAEAAAPSDLEARVKELDEELARLKDDKLRALAETENVKRRLMREKEEFQKFAVEGVLADLLPVLDNLDMALAYAEKSEACKGFVQGVEMTRKVFLDILAGHGLEATGGAGEEFNPEWHEAVGAEPSKDFPENHVCQLLQKGYKLKGRLLRPAKVLISKPC
ncbi:molecular chaperone GrpE heat shock protein [Desulfocurvibacter africanus PCS]|uniref:Protein GrpE n=1 Tax=Desulfocurvibacter africanus PCS TaxID=1262666 RepID=M5PRJ9_DESAF|nr:nucleotide exchange factor GrpE [Desulfocurvibacter africanus]EMG36764.1 molecular chaperone GrpE heat shock protein [Desulfocurvibacter africanus PCS]